MGYQPNIYRKQGADELVVASGGSITVESGGSQTLPVQTLAKTQTGTDVTNFGISEVAGSSTAPTYTLAAPTAGTVKHIALTQDTSIAGTTGYTAVVQTNSTGVSLASSGPNQITLGTSTVHNIALVGISTTKWRVCGGQSAVSGLGTQST